MEAALKVFVICLFYGSVATIPITTYLMIWGYISFSLALKIITTCLVNIFIGAEAKKLIDFIYPDEEQQGGINVTNAKDKEIPERP